MVDDLLALVAVFALGGFCGTLLMALCCAAHDEEE